MRKWVTLVPEYKLFDKIIKRLLKSWIYLDYSDYEYLLNRSCDYHDISSLGNIQLTWEAPLENFPKTTIVCETPLEKRGWVKISSMHFCEPTTLSIFDPPNPKHIYFFKLRK